MSSETNSPVSDGRTHQTSVKAQRLPFYTAQTIDSLPGSRPDTPTIGIERRKPRRRDTARRRLQYYLPAARWIPAYEFKYLAGDILGGLSTACVIVPVSLSYAANLAKIPPVYGLYAAAVGPVVYSLLGSCAQMNVGPESALSLLIGETIRSQLGQSHSTREAITITATVTFLCGAMVFLAGLLRLGFLDSVLSRPLLRGFITAVAVVIVFDQSIPALGLSALAERTGVVHFSPIEKAAFVIRNLRHTHKYTAFLSLSTLVFLICTRTAKFKLKSRAPWIISVPDILLVVIGTTLLTNMLDLDLHGVAVLGHVDARPIAPSFPVRSTDIARKSLSTAVLCSLLGFFETVVAGKSLGNTFNYHVSANREMVALGAANLANSLFGALPVFASYSRSKVNISSGGRTHLSGVICAACIAIALALLLPLFYYVPKATLSSIVVVVMFTLIQEAPHDVHFFVKTRGYAELGLMSLVFLLTLIVSLEFGIGAGVAVSLLRVVKHSQSPRVRILGRLPGTQEFLPVNESPDEVENIEGCLLVRVPEPLYFANTGQLKDRLDRLERYGDTQVHPSEPPRRAHVQNQRVVFDFDGVSDMDGAAAQILQEICTSYVTRGVDVWFCRVRPAVRVRFALAGIVQLVGQSRFRSTIHEAVNADSHIAQVIARSNAGAQELNGT